MKEKIEVNNFFHKTININFLTCIYTMQLTKIVVPLCKTINQFSYTVLHTYFLIRIQVYSWIRLFH